MEIKQKKDLKIFNDPVYGFITIQQLLVLEVIEHPYFQRLRRISQTGLTNMVYPGATHSRFHHALGCLHLMQKAITTLKNKGVQITDEEELAACLAILLHDVGHGPFSHALEHTLINTGHENLSLEILQILNKEFNGELELAIKIFQGNHVKSFLTDLIASQLDVDRLDYLKRDSFYTGVAEGNVNSDRLISMFNVIDNELVVDIKGIYSVEKFLVSRIFMYWQVYLHKTSVAAEIILNKTIARAKKLLKEGQELSCSKNLYRFLSKEIYKVNREILEDFAFLDDYDILSALKNWVNHPDNGLATLSKMLVYRKLPHTFITQKPLSSEEWHLRNSRLMDRISDEALDSFFHQQELEVQGYRLSKKPINLRYKNNDVVELTDAPQQIMREVLIQKSVKYHYTELISEKNSKVIEWLSGKSKS